MTTALIVLGSILGAGVLLAVLIVLWVMWLTGDWERGGQ